MKQLLLFFIALLISEVAFAASFILDNQSQYPNAKEQSTMAIQWSSSAKETEDTNTKLRQGLPLDKKSLLAVTKTGKVNLTIPPKATYFRVLVWVHGSKEPTLVTNWVSIEINKAYMLNDGYLMPVPLMSGMGC